MPWFRSSARRPAALRVVVVAASVLAIASVLVIVRGAGAPESPLAPPSAPPRAQDAPDWSVVLRLRDEMAEAAAHDPDYPIDVAEASAMATTPQAHTPLGRISSAAIGLDAAYAAGVQPSVLDRGPGLWPGTALPGRPGNSVLSGHRTTHTRPFADLERLRPGDPVTVTGPGGATVTFHVTETAIVPEADYVPFVLAPPADPAERRLTLFACHPEGHRTHRIVVRAVA